MNDTGSFIDLALKHILVRLRVFLLLFNQKQDIVAQLNNLKSALWVNLGKEHIHGIVTDLLQVVHVQINNFGV